MYAPPKRPQGVSDRKQVKQNLAEVLESAVTAGPVTITRRGHKSAVIISAEEFERYQTARM
ncbi:type II toxin-antitoxin system prevent-host-death family antitoxin, partial [Salmonella enterica subsp. enterica serovar Anatum]|nr:type II toxin-antitoxin system prevent-host-death family antitoxin [Salmonella enterica subsp. enterica serovar Anatum]